MKELGAWNFPALVKPQEDRPYTRSFLEGKNDFRCLNVRGGETG
jgi:hypothetical protein